MITNLIYNWFRDISTARRQSDRHDRTKPTRANKKIGGTSRRGGNIKGAKKGLSLLVVDTGESGDDLRDPPNDLRRLDRNPDFHPTPSVAALIT